MLSPIRKIIPSGAKVQRASALPNVKESFINTLVLPTERKGLEKDISRYTMLVYGREKIGKTTLFSLFPEAIFLATEPALKGIDVFCFNAERGGVTDWRIMRKAVELLEQDRNVFKTVVIDTADLAYDYCLDYVCETLGIEHPGKDSLGERDYGYSWREVAREFRTLVRRIEQTGRGVCFTSHVREEIVKPRFGEGYTIVGPSISGQGRKVIESIVDYYWYADYIRDKSGEVKRVLICSGDDFVWAGSRPSPFTKRMPQFLPLDDENGYEIIKSAFEGKYKGISLDDISPSKQSKKPVVSFLERSKVLARAKTTFPG
jgi:hypothetical protein